MTAGSRVSLDHRLFKAFEARGLRPKLPLGAPTAPGRSDFSA